MGELLRDGSKVSTREWSEGTLDAHSARSEAHATLARTQPFRARQMGSLVVNGALLVGEAATTSVYGLSGEARGAGGSGDERRNATSALPRNET